LNDQLSSSITSANERAPLLAAKEANLSASRWRHAKTLAYLASVLFVIIVGLIAWFFPGGNSHTPEGDQDIIEWKSQAFGWLSAFLYSASVFYLSLSRKITRTS
jgi:hypothetical protein